MVMKVCVRGYEPIVIPREMAVRETGAFNDQTPYVAKLVTRLNKPAYREKTLPRKLVCLEATKRRMMSLGGYKTFAEPMAGVGLSARIFEKPGCKMFLNDLDVGCRKILTHNFVKQPSPTSLDVKTMGLPSADVVFIDFNDFTLKRYMKTVTKYKHVIDEATRVSEKFVIINDCSLFYFRYGANSYETYSRLMKEPITGVEDYFVALRRLFRKNYPDWWLIEANYFRDTSFLLMSREKGKLVTRYANDVEPIVTVEP
jgi:hypothetical protein